MPPNSYGAPMGDTPVNTDREQQSTSDPDPSVVKAALAQRPNTGTRPPVAPIVRGSSGGPAKPIDHSIKVDQAVADAGG